MFKRFFPLFLLIFLFWSDNVFASSWSVRPDSATYSDSTGTYNGTINLITSGKYNNQEFYRFYDYANVPLGTIYGSFLYNSGKQFCVETDGRSNVTAKFFVMGRTLDDINTSLPIEKVYSVIDNTTYYWNCSSTDSLYTCNGFFNWNKNTYVGIKTMSNYDPYVHFNISRYLDIQCDINNQDIINNQNNNTQSLIDNANNNQSQTNERLDDINDSLTSSDTTQANSNGNSFFSNFHVDSTRGFTSIITAPVRLIQGILDANSVACSPLSFDISLHDNSTTQSNEVSLPCGSILWNNVPNTAVLLYWSTIFGLFSWWILRDMYKFVDSIRDPDDKSEFVMNL